MTEDIYRNLQERLDTYSMGFPVTDSGVEIKILKALFSVDDAEMFLRLSKKLETAESIALRLDKPQEMVTEQLEKMTEKGLLFRIRKKNSAQYAAIAFVHGLFEFQIKDLDQNLAELVDQYREEGFKNAINKSGGMFLRTVPVQQSIDVIRNIAAYDDAVSMLKGKDLIVVTECICRKQKQMVEKSCNKPMETCFMFGAMGQYYIDKGLGRKVDVEEAIAILVKAQEDGLVTQPATTQNPGGMCCCCGDCCIVLRSLKSYPKPAELVLSNYLAMVDTDQCTSCETCLERCQMDAISLDDDALAEIDHDRCIGCGLCVTTCPSGAIRLEPLESHYTPPVNTAEQMKLMAQKSGRLL